MKPLSSLLIVLFLALVFLPAFSQADETGNLPAAQFPETSYVFDPVVSGAYVTHTYAVQNTGTGLLEIQKVQTG